MSDIATRYSDPLGLIPMAAMFLIIFGIVLPSLRQIPLFAGGGRVVIAFRATTLATYGIDQTIVRAVIGQYTAMGVATFFGLAGLLLTAWIILTIKTRKHLRRSREDEHEVNRHD